MFILKALAFVSVCFSCVAVQGLTIFGDTILDVASDEGFTSLVTALSAAGFDDDLDCAVVFVCPQFTVFAPNDDAFGALDENLLTNLITNEDYIEHLRGILRYHVVRSRLLSEDIVDEGTVETALGEPVNTTVVGEIITVNDAEVLQADIEAINGIIHAVDNVLLPPFMKNNVVDVANANLSLFAVLIEAAEAAGLVDELVQADAITVFAPTNTAFAELGTALEDLFEAENKETLASILRYHVLPGITVQEKLTDGSVQTLQGEAIDVEVRRYGAQAIINDSRVTAFDILASNGVIHVIDKVLIPPSLRSTPDIVQLAMSNDDFTSLVEALVAAELVETLQGPGPFTVFAPNNDAFARLGIPLTDLLDPDNKETLVRILSYHVVPGKLKLSDLRNGGLTTSLGRDILVHLRFFLFWFIGVRLNDDTSIKTFDLEASNGVVHVIDNVLSPPHPLPDIVGLASSQGQLSKLVEAVSAAELVETLKGEGPFTVFAPTNEAFEKLETPFEELLKPENRETLVRILLYHVVPGDISSADLEEGSLQTALEGTTVEVGFRYFLWFFFGGVTINDADVIAVDRFASNGVVHLVNEVLMPPAAG